MNGFSRPFGTCAIENSNPAVNCRAILNSPFGRCRPRNVQTPGAGRAATGDASQREATRFGVHLPATAFVAVAMEKHFAVYVMASRRRGTLYIGVTSNLLKRVWEHREGVIDGFTRQYGVKKLVWFEMHDNAESAITREKQLKEWRRSGKLDLIEERNPWWRDLFLDIV